MKKKYLQPRTIVVGMVHTSMICASDSIKALNGEEDYGITYGGVDENGTKDPSSRRRDVWDEGEEEY